MTSEPPSQARVELPAWLWGGNPEQLLKECRYKARADSGSYLVQPEERYLRRKPDLIRAKALFGPGVPSRLQDLANYRERIDPPMPEIIGEALEKRRVKAESTRELLDLVNFERLAMYATPVTELPNRAEYLLGILRQMPLEGDAGVRPFDGAGLNVIEVDPVLVHRLKLASIWLRIEQDERLGKGDLTHLKEVHQQGQAFASSAGLYSGVYMLDAYVGPLLGALAPGVWGFHIVRTFGPMIFSFGRCVSGSQGDAAELLHLIATPGAMEKTPTTPLPTGAAAHAIRWWVEQLNQLFGALSDLAVFTDRTGLYRPEKHLEAMLTVEQVFRRTTSMQVAHRDSNARRTLLFSVLDSVERANGWSLDKMVTLSHAQKVLSELEASIPAGAASILLPMARQAVESLARMQDGFFIRRHMKTTDVGLRFPHGEVKILSAEAATAQYLKVLRNSTHGHGGKGKAVDLTAALLAHHDGEVPHDIGLLAYLYLLDMVANPGRLRRCFYRSGRQ